MSESPLRILQVSSHDIHGGAAKVAWDLFEAYREEGHDSYLAVGQKRSDHPDVFPIPNLEEQQKNKWFDFWHNRMMMGWVPELKRRGVPGAWRLPPFLWWLAQPGRWLDHRRGIEDFRWPGTRRLLNLAPERPDIVHCHNLHGDYFDLRFLPTLSRHVPVLLHLHDAWLLSGLCSHSFDCERWKTGCGKCPLFPSHFAPDVPPPDATGLNWRRKRRIYRRSRFYVTAPCGWLMDRVKQSILAAGALETRVIPYGVDLTLFRPGDKQAARRELAIPADARVVLFVANGIRNNPAKDYQTFRAAVSLLGRAKCDRPTLIIARGEESASEHAGSVTLQFVPFEKDSRQVARFFRAADVYLHSAQVDTFPLVVLEALACGTPVVATGVGGIPEQVKSMDSEPEAARWPTYGVDEATGVLVPPRNPGQMARAVERLLRDEALRERLGGNAAREARARFDLHRQVRDYLGWYAEILQRDLWAPSSSASRKATLRPAERAPRPHQDVSSNNELAVPRGAG